MLETLPFPHPERVRTVLHALRAAISRRGGRFALAGTVVVAVAAVACFALTVLYFALPAASMPGLLPGLSVPANAPHRYRAGVTTLAFGLMLGYIAELRFRQHIANRHRYIDLTSQPQGGDETAQEPDDAVRTVDDEIRTRG